MKSSALFAALFAVWVQVSFAEEGAEPAPGTVVPPVLNEVLQDVLRYHPFLSATEEEIQFARGELLSNNGAFDPVLKGESSFYPTGDYSGTYSSVFAEQPLEWMGTKLIAGYRRGGGGFPIYENFNETNEDGEVRVGIEIPVARDGIIDRRRASIQRAALQVDSAGATLIQRKIELVRGASFSFWDWIAAVRKYHAYSELVTVAEARDKQLEQRVSLGDFAAFDRTDNQRQVLQRRAQQVAAERALRKAEFDLSLFLWTESGAPGASLPKPVLESVLLPKIVSRVELERDKVSAIGTRPEVVRLDYQLKQQGIERVWARNQLLPKVDLKVYGSQDYGDGSDSRDDAELKVGVSVEVPLRTRGQEGRLHSIAAKERELFYQRKILEQKISTEVEDAYVGLQVALTRASIASEEVDLARELEKGERVKFDQGDSNLIFVNLREQSTTDSLVRNIEAVSDAWKAYASYQAVTGRY